MFNRLADVLGLLYSRKEQSLDEEIEAFIAQRTKARAEKDWETADRIRDELKAVFYPPTYSSITVQKLLSNVKLLWTVYIIAVKI